VYIVVAPSITIPEEIQSEYLYVNYEQDECVLLKGV
jgi:hypothetical protein